MNAQNMKRFNDVFDIARYHLSPVLEMWPKWIPSIQMTIDSLWTDLEREAKTYFVDLNFKVSKGWDGFSTTESVEDRKARIRKQLKKLANILAQLSGIFLAIAMDVEQDGYRRDEAKQDIEKELSYLNELEQTIRRELQKETFMELFENHNMKVAA